MAKVKVDITTISIFKGIGLPGGVLYDWRDKTAEQIVVRARVTAPLNSPANAVHRGGKVGGFKLGMAWERYGNQHGLGFRFFNTADHARYAELGRGDSHRFQRFSWVKWAGEIRKIYPGPDGVSAHGWEGNHTMRNAVNKVMASATGGEYTPLS